MPNISRAVRKHGNILSVDKAFKGMLQNEVVTAFRRSKNLKELLGSNKIEYNKVKKHHNIRKKGKCSPCSVNNRTLCCKQVISSSTFKECTLCKNQNVGKSEACFNIRLNNHRRDVKKPVPY